MTASISQSRIGDEVEDSSTAQFPLSTSRRFMVWLRWVGMTHRTFHHPPPSTNNLRSYRQRAGLTQEQVAFAMGFSTTAHISEWENGKRQPTLIAAMRLAQLLETYVEHLFPLHWSVAHRSLSQIPPRRVTLRL